MAKRKIIWSHKARIKLYEIMDFYIERNGNSAYSAKLYKLFTKNIKLLLSHPNLGIKTDIEGVRGLVIADYIIFYELIGNDLVIHTLWPTKQDPNKLIIK